MLETTQIIANIVLLISVIIATIQLYQNRLAVKADHERRKKEATISFTHEIISQSNRLNDTIADVFGSDAVNRSDPRYQKQVDGIAVKDIIREYLSLMERISVGLNTGVYDIEIFARICGRKTIRSWNRLQNLIMERRKSQDSLYIEFEDVVGKLTKLSQPSRNTSGDIEYSDF